MSYGPEPLDERGRLPTSCSGELTGHEGPVLAVRYNHSGQYCLSCGKDRTFRLWNPSKGLLIKTYSGHAHEVRDVQATQDNSKIVSVGGDKQVFLWDVASGRTIRKFHGHNSAVNAVLFAASETVALTAGYDQAVKAWDLRSNSSDPIQTMAPFRDSVTSLALDGPTILAGSVDGTVRSFDIRLGAGLVPTSSLRGNVTSDDLGAPVTSIRLTADGNCLLASTIGAGIRLIDRASGTHLADFSGHTNEIAKMECGFTSSDAFVVSGSEDGTLWFWEVVDGEVVAKVQAHAPGKTVCGLAVHPTEEALLTCATDGLVRIFEPPH